MHNEDIKRVLAKRRDRVIAIILGTKERELDPHVSYEASMAFRKVIMDQMNDFYDLVLDLLGSIDDQAVVINQLYLDKIDEIFNAVIEDYGD